MVLRDADIYLATFGATRAQMEAVAGVLVGEVESELMTAPLACALIDPCSEAEGAAAPAAVRVPQPRAVSIGWK